MVHTHLIGVKSSIFLENMEAGKENLNTDDKYSTWYIYRKATKNNSKFSYISIEMKNSSYISRYPYLFSLFVLIPLQSTKTFVSIPFTATQHFLSIRNPRYHFILYLDTTCFIVGYLLYHGLLLWEKAPEDANYSVCGLTNIIKSGISWDKIERNKQIERIYTDTN